MTSFGRSSDYRVIYKTDLNGQNQEIVYDWTPTTQDAEVFHQEYHYQIG